MGSASELEYFALRARDLRYLPPNAYERLAKQVGDMRRMLNGLLSRVRQDTSSSRLN